MSKIYLEVRHSTLGNLRGYRASVKNLRTNEIKEYDFSSLSPIGSINLGDTLDSFKLWISGPSSKSDLTKVDAGVHVPNVNMSNNFKVFLEIQDVNKKAGPSVPIKPPIDLFKGGNGGPDLPPHRVWFESLRVVDVIIKVTDENGEFASGHKGSIELHNLQSLEPPRKIEDASGALLRAFASDNSQGWNSFARVEKLLGDEQIPGQHRKLSRNADEEFIFVA